jgi:hypothetical protein
MHSGRYLALSGVEKTTLSYCLGQHQNENKSTMTDKYPANSFGSKTEQDSKFLKEN